ncbi:hypothetical protein HDV57DRAFT_402658 [Trichoderma longibrachiatum]
MPSPTIFMMLSSPVAHINPSAPRTACVQRAACASSLTMLNDEHNPFRFRLCLPRTLCERYPRQYLAYKDLLHCTCCSVLHDYRFLYQDRLNNDKASSRLPWSFQLTWRSGAWPADSPFRRTPSGARREKGISLLPGLEDETHSRTNFSPVGSSWLDVVRGQGLFSHDNVWTWSAGAPIIQVVYRNLENDESQYSSFYALYEQPLSRHKSTVFNDLTADYRPHHPALNFTEQQSRKRRMRRTERRQ